MKLSVNIVFMSLLSVLCAHQDTLFGAAQNSAELDSDLDLGMCPDDEFFKCQGDASVCINKRNVCDGTRDCPDNSDEALCECGAKRRCEGNYKCQINRVDAISICSPCDEGLSFNGKQCNDIDECASRDNNCPSDHSCLNTHGSYECAKCRKGFVGKIIDLRYLNSFKNDSVFREMLLCDDFNECEDSQKCSSTGVCVNKVGSFSCSCPPEHHPDGRVCTAEGELPKIVLADNSTVYVYDLRSETVEKNFTLSTPSIVDIAASRDKVFYATHNQIWEYHVNTERKYILANFENESFRIRKLAVDWDNKRVYFVTSESVAVVDFFGQGGRLFDHRGTIYTIAIDALARYMFYSESGHLIRANLDGSNATVIFQALPIMDENVQSGDAVAVDIILKSVYFISDRVLYTVDYDGRNALVMNTMAAYAKIDVFENLVYATHRSDGSGLIALHRPGYAIGSPGRDGSTYRDSVRFFRTRPKSLAIMHPSKFLEPDQPSVCQRDDQCPNRWCFPMPHSKPEMKPLFTNSLSEDQQQQNEPESFKCVCHNTRHDHDCLAIRLTNYKPEDVNARISHGDRSLASGVVLAIVVSISSVFSILTTV